MTFAIRAETSRRSGNATWIVGALVFVVIVWGALLTWAALTLEGIGMAGIDGRPRRSAAKLPERDSAGKIPLTPASSEGDDFAREIPGVELRIPSPLAGEDPIEIVYAGDASTAFTGPPKGLAVLLHACTHSALKFFSPSLSCPDCVGLSEELRIARLVTEWGYVPLAVSSFNRKNGCWSARDVPRIEAVLSHALFRRYHDIGGSIFGIGASSGGAFAADLATKNIVEGALVMVMHLSRNVVSKMQTSPVPIYLAPMSRDKGTLKRVIENYQDLDVVREFVILDRTNCAPLPVTKGYLIQRVPGMTSNAADGLISQLKQAGHIDFSSNMLHVDPTHSDWKRIISPGNSTCWMNLFDLTPGHSPLAKALHRAWAFHEYCSEAVMPALRFFEERKSV